jgi:phosphoribosylanthranilate isomerase
MLRVKICGITNLEDAIAACGAGADALGFVFYKGSPRYISPLEAGEIIRSLPPFLTPVGVFVDDAADVVRESAVISGVRVLQFHGSESPDYCRSFGMPYVKAFRVRDMESLSGLERYADASAYLLDAFSESEFGGTGMTFNWDAAVYAKRFGRIILAGGLTPENVAKAVSTVMPYAVDVSSGVEAAKGRKDHEAVKRFIANAKGHDPNK